SELSTNTRQPLCVGAHRYRVAGAHDASGRNQRSLRPVVGKRRPGEVTLDAGHPSWSELPVVPSLETADRTELCTSTRDGRRGDDEIWIGQRPARLRLPCR